MKQYILFLFFLILTISSEAQLSLSADTAYFNGFRKDDFEHCNALIRIKNNDVSNSVSCTWQKTNDNFLNGWSGLYITANNIDFPYNSTSHSFIIAPGDSTYVKLYMKTLLNADDGCSEVQLTLTSSGLSSAKNILFRYCTWPTILDETSLTNPIQISPNPFVHNIHIRTSNQLIDHINLSTMTGQKIESFYKIPQLEEFDLKPCSNLISGVYFLTLFDMNNRIIEVRKLIKNSF